MHMMLSIQKHWTLKIEKNTEPYQFSLLSIFFANGSDIMILILFPEQNYHISNICLDTFKVNFIPRTYNILLPPIPRRCACITRYDKRRSIVTETGIKGRDKQLHPTDTAGRNYLSLSLIAVSGTKLLNSAVYPTKYTRLRNAFVVMF